MLNCLNTKDIISLAKRHITGRPCGDGSMNLALKWDVSPVPLFAPFIFLFFYYSTNHNSQQDYTNFPLRPTASPYLYIFFLSPTTQKTSRNFCGDLSDMLRMSKYFWTRAWKKDHLWTAFSLYLSWCVRLGIILNARLTIQSSKMG